MKTVIIPTDFSDNAWKAAGYAASLYHHTPCNYILAHSYRIPEPPFDGAAPGAITTLARESHRDTMRVLEDFMGLDHSPQSTFEVATRYGHTADVIISQAEIREADIVVMGTQGADSTPDTIFGSNTSNVADKVNCPVLCVPSNAVLNPPKHILLALDYEELEDPNCLWELKKIAQEHGSKVSMVHIRDSRAEPVPVDNAMEGLVVHNYLGDIEHDYYDHLDNDTDDGILDFAHQKEVDLIAVLRRQRNFWQRLFHTSITRQLALHSDIPLLVLQE